MYQEKYQPLIIIILLFLVVAGSIFIGYRYGFNDGIKDGFHRATLEIQRVGGENIQNRALFSNSGIVLSITQDKITITEETKEKEYKITNETKFYRDYNIPSSDFDVLEKNFKEIKEEYTEAERLEGASEELKKEYLKIEKEYNDILKYSQVGEKQISLDEIKTGSFVTINHENNTATTIKDFK